MSGHSVIVALAIDPSGNIYAALTNSSNHGYVAKYDGSSWSDAGNLSSNSTILSICTDIYGNVYETDASYGPNNQPVVRVYDGTTWKISGGGTAVATGGLPYVVTSDAEGNVYTSGDLFNTGNRIVAKLTNASVLPVKLLSFNGVRSKGNIVTLFWATGTESKNSGFEIQGSDDKNNFTNISFVSGGGTSSITKTYKNSFESTNIYFRLKQIDADGKFNYSGIIKLPLIKSSGLTVYPNPFSTTIKITSDKIQHAQLTDISGRLIKSADLTSGATDVETSTLPPGVYILQTESGAAIKLIKNNP